MSVTDQDWERSIALTLMAAVRTTRAALPQLVRRGGGSIVTVSSVNASAAGIRVNTVSPGPVETTLWLGEHGVAQTLADAGGATPSQVAAQAHRQELLANSYAAAAVAIDPAPIRGVKVLPFAQLRSGFPVPGNPANRKRTVSLTAKQFRFSFGNAVTEKESDALFEQWRSPVRAGRSSRTPRRTSAAVPRLPSTRTTPSAGRCC